MMCRLVDEELSGSAAIGQLLLYEVVVANQPCDKTPLKRQASMQQITVSPLVLDQQSSSADFSNNSTRITTVTLEGDNTLGGLGHGHGVALEELHNMDGSLNGGLNVDGINGTLNSLMESPPHAVYTALEDLLIQANNFATARGYKLVVVRSKTNPDGQKTWVHLACDRHGMLLLAL
jgi:hypothetical protein